MPDFGGIAYVSHTAESLPIDFNNGIITQARLTATITNLDVYDVEFYLTANGVNFEQVDNGITYTFINTGDDLRWKIRGSGGFQITNLVIDNYH